MPIYFLRHAENFQKVPIKFGVLLERNCRHVRKDLTCAITILMSSSYRLDQSYNMIKAHCKKLLQMLLNCVLLQRSTSLKNLRIPMQTTYLVLAILMCIFSNPTFFTQYVKNFFCIIFIITLKFVIVFLLFLEKLPT